jgi:hypothetical protein
MVDRLATAMHRLLLATERDDATELQAAREQGMAVHGDAFAQSWARMAELLPAWFVERMSGDVWHFGLLLTTGQTLYAETLLDVTQAADGSLWLELRLAENPDSLWMERAAESGWPKVTVCPTSRDTCSVAVAHVVCVVELADT